MRIPEDQKKSCQRFVVCLAVFVFCLTLLFSCGYRIVGSKYLPFDSVTIRPVKNRTYEPRLEERLHNALSKEFVLQNIKIAPADGDIDLETVIKTFELVTIAAVDEKVKEQAIVMHVDVRIIDNGKVTEFRSMKSPIKITFQATGTVSEAVAQKEGAIDKTCAEIAKEIVSKVIIKYAK
jgi:hypothetical protein